MSDFDYRQFLSNLLAVRKRKNPRYSQRALARDLHLGTSTIAQIISGKRNLSLEAALRLALQLRLAPGDARSFCRAVILEGVKCPELRKALADLLPDLNTSDGPVPR